MKQAPKHPVRLERQGSIALIVIENPPVNALGGAVRRGIAAALSAAEANPLVTAIVICANGRTFPAGADIREFNQPAQEPGLGQLCTMIETCSKPVVAALHGTALGGGLELAMGAHFRIASTDARVGLPEINLGILPGAGGTQRLPRLVGAELAMDMMLAGAPVSAGIAAEMGLIDRVTGGDLREAAVAFARELSMPHPTAEQRGQFSDANAYMAATKARRAELKQTGQASRAALKIIDCVEAALLVPIETGLEMERAAFEECLRSPESQGMRHAFFAERAAAKFPEDAPPRDISRIGIVGGGMMGAGIAIACLQRGFDVTLVEQGESGVNTALERIGTHYERAIAKGRLSEAQGAAALTHLQLTTKLDTLGDADVIIEAVGEDEELKLRILKEIGDQARQGAVLATNTSYLDLMRLAQATGRPNDTVGLHFFAPAQVNKLVEVAVHDDADASAVSTAQALVKRLGKVAVRAKVSSGVGAGYIGNRVLEAYRLAADILLEEGATPQQIDTAMRGFGFKMGPYQVADMSGLDIAHARRQSSPRDADARYVEIADKIVAQGWLGQKTHRGYYVYPEGARDGVPNGDVLKLIAAHRAENGITEQSFTEAEIRDTLLLTMVNAGAQLLTEGVAARPGDVDTVMIHGFGYPRSRGGPMFEADTTTPALIMRRLEALQAQAPNLWTPAPLLRELARERRKFADLN
ncbi:3-hydroxyacyl-CoA dehydrogenase [Litoreibacter ponti]|uniref:3-hydroxyacyl-CoA dehydrogenase n=1 Tax=Litoreibacter ponti TaxID=1510457 RepID=A0A2T6BHA4_9RHOB|nr:3-hydroxyacyl-CoA dehydrogenase NAD-binding domain-containing protein [Litoreibacter ponti]PTX55440.1 3-hydroxyacyl-CoA dehydrogenase [Litoreibacter ponti]